MTEAVAIPLSVSSEHLPFKGGDWIAHAAAPCGKLVGILAQLATRGDECLSKLPISPLEGEISARLTKGGDSLGHWDTGGHADVC